MSAVRGANVPTKSNRQRDKGISAITGKSNFDISEWILLHFLNRLSGRSAVLAMLCKSVVARKVLRHAWANRLQLKASAIYLIDASKIFGVAVDACLLICTLEPNERSKRCFVYSNLESTKPESLWGLHRGRLAADLEAANATGHLMGRSPVRWRSGIKHDCANVMELFPKRDGYFRNGLGETVSMESKFLFPMLKSSELVQSLARPSRFMLVTQRSVGDDTAQIKAAAPKTWNYLESHAHQLDVRASAIYKNRPKFSVFGVGKYTFAPWKVAISGFYKQFRFRVIGPVNGKPIVFDDTCYFLPCWTEADARNLREMLQSDIATRYFGAFVFWDAKRPITAGLLGSLNLNALARQLGVAAPSIFDQIPRLPLPA